MDRLIMGFYGDDFTGSTDAMECLELNGIPAALYLQPPTIDQIEADFPGIRSVGIAGITRSLPVSRLEEELRPAFEAIRRLDPEFVHYKICSTFDSSPEVGSIGKAIDLGWDIFRPEVVPVMVGAPFLRRYVVFGNLFARVGDTTYRLDRHPTMSRHPVTPMGESDLRLHLGAQTGKPIGLLDVLQLGQGEEAIDRRFRELVDAGTRIVLFDTLGTEEMAQIGRLVWSLRGERPVLLVGSSGFEYALGLFLGRLGLLTPPGDPVRPGIATGMVVISGSCAPGTAAQIEWALSRGFAGVRLDTRRLLDPSLTQTVQDATVKEALALLEQGRSPLIYSALGPADPAIVEARHVVAGSGADPIETGARLGHCQGTILRRIAEASGVRRICVTGGDTCGRVARQLGLYALRMIIPVAPGAPLCRGFSRLPALEGLEISLKGGQNGNEDYFGRILLGLTSSDPLDEEEVRRVAAGSSTGGKAS